MVARGAKEAELRVSLAHLYRRAGFGARPEELDAAVAAGYEATVDALVDLSAADGAASTLPPPTFTPPVAAAQLPHSRASGL